jgi:hypothetical protein
MKSLKSLTTGFLALTTKFLPLANAFIDAIQKEFKLKVEKSTTEIPAAIRWTILKTDKSYVACIDLYYDGTVHIQMYKITAGERSNYFFPAREKVDVFNLNEETAIIKIIATLKALRLE